MTTADVRREVASAVLLELNRADRTKRWLSQRAGIPYSTLDRKLNGHVDFTFTELAEIARALDVPPSTLTPRLFARQVDAA